MSRMDFMQQITRTAEVMLMKCEAIDECWNCIPTTAAAARWPLFSTNIACVAVIRGRSSPAPENKSRERRAYIVCVHHPTRAREKQILLQFSGRPLALYLNTTSCLKTEIELYIYFFFQYTTFSIFLPSF